MTSKPSSAGAPRTRQPGPDGLIGLVQFTAAVRVGHASRSDPVIDPHGLSEATVRAIARTVSGLFKTPGFEVHGLTKVPGRAPDWVPDPPAHSWLGTRSRHVAVRLPDYFYDAREPIPACLDFGAGNRRPGPESFPQWISYKRLQAAASPCDDAPGNPAGAVAQLCLDATDHVIRARAAAADGAPADAGQPSGEVSWAALEAAQAFLAELWAQRKADVFASRLSERVYHVWFPPGSLLPTPEHDLTARCGLGTVAVCPVVTFVRRPGERVFRRTIAVSMVLVPVRDCAGTGGRAFGPDEISTLLQMICEPATQVHNRAAATLSYSLDGPLLDYLAEAAISGADQRPLTADIIAREWRHRDDQPLGPGPSSCRAHPPTGTLRQWAELIVTAAAERGIAPGDDPWHSTRELADEVLASLRLSSTWLASVLHDKIQSGTDWVRGADDRDRPELSTQPFELTSLLNQLAMRTRAGQCPKPLLPGRFPIELFTRIDQQQTLDSNALAWHVAGRRGIVLACNRSAEQFPGRSSLNSFGSFSHMLIAASCSIDMIEALLQEAVWQPDTLHRARSAYDLLVELEDLVDLDTAWPSYRVMWRRYLHALGIDDRYRMVLERVQLLARYADVKERQQALADRDRERKFEAMITLLATAFGLGVLILSDAVLFAASAQVHTWTIIVTLAVAALTAVTIALRDRLAAAYLRHERHKRQPPVTAHGDDANQQLAADQHKPRHSTRVPGSARPDQ